MKTKGIIIGAMAMAILLAIVFFALRGGQPGDGDHKSSGSDSLFDGLPGTGSSGGDSTRATDGFTNPAALVQARAMHKALPGNVFLPPLPDRVDRIRMDKRNHLLNRLRRIHYRIEKGDASTDEIAEYYEFRVKYNHDKIAMLKYVAVRGKTPGAGANAMAPHITKMIEELETEIKVFQAKIPPR